MSENVETQEATESEAKTRRGRPRPQEVMQRDERVRELLASGPKTRNELATALSVDPNTAYLSIFRLRRAGQVEKVRVEYTENGENGEAKTRSRFAWQLVQA